VARIGNFNAVIGGYLQIRWNLWSITTMRQNI